ncbi:MAG: preprotein translocase subunit SecE [Saprospiraceae bacterium]|jgi:preprotein translocase subunit SecE|nr:preprotein translocase subunit SecE [Saprospiraceae bacterium]MBK8054270.1 preprotein translocase subunit SecE [Saprospiraceae bacterium]MBK9564557.1 preprotein translocase subunit SecE [Saprospiraceae bacterium]MBP6447567.1 preprotein translocase subunit SecE [Saprospiraceae bacterium]
MENIRLYLKESYDELMNHVTWPSWDELMSSAKLVLVSTIILSLIVFIFDFIANSSLKFIYEL